MSKTSIEISIVTSVYNVADFIPDFYSRTVKAAEKLTNAFEIIFVNDGSPDNSAEIISSLLQKDERVILVNLSRNFGHHQAIMAGLTQARGNKIFLIDSDLEEDPEWLIDFNKEMETGKWDVVYGIQKSRKGHMFEQVSGTIFYKLINIFSNTQIPVNLCTVRLMKRQYIDELTRIGDKNLFLGGVFAWIGFRQTGKVVTKTLREKHSTYLLRHKAQLAINAVTSFSSMPLWLVMHFGFLLSILSLVSGIFISVQKVFFHETIGFDWKILMVSVWFLGGLIIMFIGGSGIYIAKIFEEVKQRPPYIVQEVLQKKAPKSLTKLQR